MSVFHLCDQGLRLMLHRCNFARKRYCTPQGTALYRCRRQRCHRMFDSIFSDASCPFSKHKGWGTQHATTNKQHDHKHKMLRAEQSFPQRTKSLLSPSEVLALQEARYSCICHHVIFIWNERNDAMFFNPIRPLHSAETLLLLYYATLQPHF